MMWVSQFEFGASNMQSSVGRDS